MAVTYAQATVEFESPQLGTLVFAYHALASEATRERRAR
jgi:hypothetical protein